MIIDSDYHNHTCRCLCALPDAAVSSIVGGLEKLGFRSIGISDHYYPDKPMAQWLQEVRSEIQETRSPARVSVGIEVDMLSPGRLEATEEDLAGYDYVMAACPHFHNPHVAGPIAGDYTTIAQCAYDYMLSAAAVPYIDVIVHPFDARGLKERIPGFDLTKAMEKLSKPEYQRIADLLAQNHIAVELTERLRQPEYFDAVSPFLLTCRDTGVLFSFGSDSHALGHLASVRRAQEAIESLGIAQELIWSPEQET